MMKGKKNKVSKKLKISKIKKAKKTKPKVKKRYLLACDMQQINFQKPAEAINLYKNMNPANKDQFVQNFSQNWTQMKPEDKKVWFNECNKGQEKGTAKEVMFKTPVAALEYYKNEKSEKYLLADSIKLDFTSYLKDSWMAMSPTTRGEWRKMVNDPEAKELLQGLTNSFAESADTVKERMEASLLLKAFGKFEQANDILPKAMQKPKKEKVIKTNQVSENAAELQAREVDNARELLKTNYKGSMEKIMNIKDSKDPDILKAIITISNTCSNYALEDYNKNTKAINHLDNAINYLEFAKSVLEEHPNLYDVSKTKITQGMIAQYEDRIKGLELLKP